MFNSLRINHRGKELNKALHRATIEHSNFEIIER